MTRRNDDDYNREWKPAYSTNDQHGWGFVKGLMILLLVILIGVFVWILIAPEPQAASNEKTQHVSCSKSVAAANNGICILEEVSP